MKKQLILIIEDNADVRENLEEILSLSGYDVDAAENGKEGIVKAKEILPDLILCDVMMPILDGYGVLKMMNEDPKLLHIPFMFLTAKSAMGDFRKGMGLGADDYIAKPFDDLDLLNSIEVRLKKAQKTQIFDHDSNPKQFYDEAMAHQELEELIANQELRKYRKKDIIYEAKQYPRWIYYIKTGTVKCYQINEFGKEMITHLYAKGDIFGYIPVINNGQYHNFASPFSETELILISPSDFLLVLKNNRDFISKFIEKMAHQTHICERKLIEMAYSSVRKRVANSLLILSKKMKTKTISISREDLASLAGTTRETTIRTLTDFKKEDLITIYKSEIEITNFVALEDMPQ
jgi:CheY-like chemotaxis protein